MAGEISGIANSQSNAHQWSKWLRHTFGILISVLCLCLIAWRIDFNEVVSAISNFEWIWLTLGITSLAAGYFLRILRWSFLLRAGGAHVTASECAAPFMASIALNNTLPIRMGDAVRALYTASLPFMPQSLYSDSEAASDDDGSVAIVDSDSDAS